MVPSVYHEMLEVAREGKIPFLIPHEEEGEPRVTLFAYPSAQLPYCAHPHMETRLHGFVGALVGIREYMGHPQIIRRYGG